jgi:predicted aldo/keto reductase-like oxidoreductase
MTSFDQLELNAKVLTDISLTEHEKQDLVAASSEQGLFCTGCKQCLADCPHNIPVPDLMRAYMYAYGYSLPSMAKSLIGELGIKENPCENCDMCKIRCSGNFRIKEKITDISRLADIPSDFLA